MTTPPIAVVLGSVSVPLAAGLFLGGTLLSLASSTVLVQRIERLGGCLSLSNAAVGLLAALCADAPEITSSVTAFARHQPDIGLGVVFGSNVFNLAALLGLAAVTAGAVALRRRSALLEGTVGGFVALVSLLVALRRLPAPAGLGLTVAALVPYAGLTVVRRPALRRLGVPSRAATWLARAVREEGEEVAPALPPRERGRRAAPEAAAASVALVVVVVASVAMETGATSIGSSWHVPSAVVGGLVLAAVTSLPNAVAGVYLASRGRGAAVMSGAMNSNTLNVMAGLLIPGAVAGIPAEPSSAEIAAVFYVALTAVAVTLAVARRGITRASGAVIVAAYLCFVVVTVAR